MISEARHYGGSKLFVDINPTLHQESEKICVMHGTAAVAAEVNLPTPFNSTWLEFLVVHTPDSLYTQLDVKHNAIVLASVSANNIHTFYWTGESWYATAA